MAPAANLSAQPTNSTAQLTLKQVLNRIFAHTQKNDDQALTAWHVETGDCGGWKRRAAPFNPPQHVFLAIKIQGWMSLVANPAIHDWIASSPFTKPVPAQLGAVVRSALEASAAVGGRLLGLKLFRPDMLLPLFLYRALPRGKRVYTHARQSLIEHGYLLLIF